MDKEIILFGEVKENSDSLTVKWKNNFEINNRSKYKGYTTLHKPVNLKYKLFLSTTKFIDITVVEVVAQP